MIEKRPLQDHGNGGVMTDLFDQIYHILDGDDVYEVCMQDGSMGKDILAGRLVELFKSLEPESGARIPVWIPVAPDQRNRAEAWYDPTRKGWVLDVHFPAALDHNVCDFDCDNCHNGGCGNPACDRGGCPEENAAREAEDKIWAAAQEEGHTSLRCQVCMTSVCRLVFND